MSEKESPKGRPSSDTAHGSYDKQSARIVKPGDSIRSIDKPSARIIPPEKK